MYKFIYDLEELKKFYDIILPPLNDNEVYFISLSARKKYLPSDMKNLLDGSSEMFERRLIDEKDWNMFLRTIKRYECNDGAYTNKEGIEYPNDAMIVYMNFNPCNIIKAYEEFIMKSTQNMMNLALGKGSDPKYFKRINHALMTAMHHSRGTKHYVDIDIDYKPGMKITSKGKLVLEQILSVLKQNNVKFFVIDTHGGYHVLMFTETIRFNYANEMKNILLDNSDILDDIMPNGQGMIPLPGCSQADYVVSCKYNLSNF